MRQQLSVPSLTSVQCNFSPVSSCARLQASAPREELIWSLGSNCLLVIRVAQIVLGDLFPRDA